MLSSRHQRYLAVVGLILCGVFAVLLLRDHVHMPDDLPAHGTRANELGPPIDPNTATAGDLAALPGIGPSKAAALVEFRGDSKPFRQPIDLLAVPGWGPALVEQTEPYLRFDLQ
ncbi:MAG: helix-hairpin-helix domain-containing protein [Planctomycetota bacterium]